MKAPEYLSIGRVLCLWVCVSAVGIVMGCDRGASHGKTSGTSTAARVATSNSYFEAAVRDILGDDEPVLRLAEPGMCPGHFDIRPSQVNELRRCRLLFRFDFQKSLDAKLGPLADDGLDIHAIRTPGGLGVPASYIEAVRQMAEALVEAQLIAPEVAEERFRLAEQRVTSKGDWCRAQVRSAGWYGRPVLSSAHQEDFCAWLGLEVAATFSGADAATVGEIERAIRAGEVAAVNAVIVNRPEGRRLADALGERLNARVVVFDNFPVMQGDEPPFDGLLTTNVKALLGEELN